MIRKHAPIVCIVSSATSVFLLFVTSLVGFPQIVMGLIRGLTAFACFSSIGYLSWQVAGFFGFQPDQIQPYLEVPDYSLRFDALGSADVREKHPVVETLDESYAADIIKIENAYKIVLKNCGDFPEILAMSKGQVNPTWLKNIVIYEDPSWTWSLSKFGASRRINMLPLPNGHDNDGERTNVIVISRDSFWLVKNGDDPPDWNANNGNAEPTGDHNSDIPILGGFGDGGSQGHQG